MASLERIVLTEELGGLFERVRLRHRWGTEFRLEGSHLIGASSKKGKVEGERFILLCGCEKYEGSVG